MAPRYSAECGNELAGLQVVTEKFVAGLVAIGEQALAVNAGSRKKQCQGAIGQLERPALDPLEQSRLLAKGPEVHTSPSFLPLHCRYLIACEENEVLPVRCPVTATRRRRWMPAGQ